MTNLYKAVICVAAAVWITAAHPVLAEGAGYTLTAGDRLAVTVWKDPDLSREVLVAPDGAISFPLAGDLSASGKTVSEISAEITTRLSDYIDDPVVTVALLEVRGSRIYVIGKVNRPGVFVLDGELDVMQALSLAGGMTAYADVNGIRIIRRIDGESKALRFAYNEVARGKKLEQNILLQNGDTVVVN
ncbi:MAG: polysaccharide biosynthesis/export family protein [Pseudomonadota bacterium]